VKRALVVLLAGLLAASCASRRPAPVSERAPEAPAAVAEAPKPVEAPPPPVEKPLPTHTVKKGETMVGIALQYGLDYRELAAWNNIVNPNSIRIGQVLVVARPTGSPATAALAPARRCRIRIAPWRRWGRRLRRARRRRLRRQWQRRFPFPRRRRWPPQRRRRSRSPPAPMPRTSTSCGR
jgi:hypothetical protein